jgi:hypothetical protein
MDDPSGRQWTASIPMRRSDELIFEYACHEANYGLEGVEGWRTPRKPKGD